MGWLFEDSTTVLTAGVLIQVLLAVVLVRTGRGAVLVAMGAVFVLVLLLLVVEYAVVTPGEEVQDTLQEAAAAVEANDVEAFMSFVQPEASAKFSEVRRRMPNFVIKSVRSGQLAVDVDKANSDTAMARFVASVVAREKTGQIPREQYVARFRIDLKRIDDRWVFTGYEEQPLTGNGS